MLGFAFAAGDLLLELRPDGTVAVAIGAAATVTGGTEAALVGKPLAEILSEADVSRIVPRLAGMAPGARLGPMAVRLARSGRPATVRLCRLPQRDGHLSCVLALGDDAGEGAAPPGMVAPEAFPDAMAERLAAADRAGARLNLDLVELPGLQAAVARLRGEAGDALLRQVAGVLAADSAQGVVAAEVATDRFAVVREDAPPIDALLARLADLSPVGVAPTGARLVLDGAGAAQNLRALRYALDRYIEDGAAAAERGFNATMRRTLDDQARFRAIVADRAFHLAYQPVVDLNDESLHHFEALARFEPDGSPAQTIQLAEELGMIESFDLAVAEMVAAVLVRTPPEVSVAVNVSARSLMQEGFLDRFTAVAGAEPALRARLLVEITETAALADLALADARIQTLRGRGHRVCLDDFGAGAATLEYIQRLEVDFLKIDGRYLRDLEGDARNRVVLRHIIGLCRELAMPTIVEMVETREAARVAAELGAQLAQGWLFGKPRPEPVWDPPPPATIPVRRVGAVEQWG